MTTDQKAPARDDELLRALGRLAAEEDELSPDEELLARWCAGALDADEQKALEMRAAGDVELARKLEAYRPLDAAFRARLAERLAPASPALPPRVAPARRGPLAWRWGAGGVALAAAAAFFLWVRPPSHDGGTSGARLAALPRFDVETAGGDRETRGGASNEPSHAVRVLRPESRLTLTVRPATAVDGAVVVDAFARPPAAASSTLERLPLPFAISETGVAHVSGRADALFGARRGPWELRLLVVRASAPAEARRAWAEGTAPMGDGWQRLDVELMLVDEDGRRDPTLPR